MLPCLSSGVGVILVGIYTSVPKYAISITTKDHDVDEATLQVAYSLQVMRRKERPACCFVRSGGPLVLALEKALSRCPFEQSANVAIVSRPKTLVR